MDRGGNSGCVVFVSVEGEGDNESCCWVEDRV